jgi:hypothetical protein
MRKVKIGVALFAVLAFGAISAASASAAPLWLKGGASITKQELAETTGTWTLTGHGIFGIGELEVECMGRLIGWVGPGNEDLVTEATELTNHNKLINCKVIKESVAKCLTSLALVEGEHLPWKTELLENAGKEVSDDFKSDGNGVPAFRVLCELSSGKFTEELCEGIVKTDTLINLGSGKVEGKVLKVASEKCKGSGNTAEVSAAGETDLSLSTEALTAHNSP